LLAERRRPKDGRQRVGEESVDRLAVEVCVGRAPCQHEQHGQAIEARGKELQEPQRRRVGPVDVVERECDRRLLAQVGGEPVERMEVRQRRVRANGVRIALESVACQQCRGGSGCAMEEPRSALAVRAGEERLEQLAHDAERELTIQLGRARRQDDHPPLRRLRSRCLEQPRLADSGRALDEREPPSPGTCFIDHAAELGQLALALVQDGGPSVRHDAQRLPLHRPAARQLREKFRVQVQGAGGHISAPPRELSLHDSTTRFVHDHRPGGNSARAGKRGRERRQLRRLVCVRNHGDLHAAGEQHSAAAEPGRHRNR
jgi:hypothetical protein